MRTQCLMRARSVYLVGLLLSCPGCLFLSCGGAATIVNLTTEARLERGLELYQDKRFEKAVEDFRYVTFNAPGSEYGDDAQYFLAKCHFGLKEYVLAVSEYERLRRIYPDSPLLPDAAYGRAESFDMLSPKYSLDQEYTTKALVAYQEFLEDYPENVRREEAQARLDDLRFKLAKKIFENGKLYYRMSEYTPAIIYLEQILDQYYDSGYATPARWYIAQSHAKLHRVAEAVAVLHSIIERSDSAEYIEKARRMLAELTGGEIGDEQSKSGELDSSEPA